MPPRRPSLVKHLLAIKRAVAELETVFATAAARLRHAERLAARKVKATGKRRLTITPARRAQLKLQGAYMGFMRQLRPRQKAKVRAIKERRGFEAAIGVARKIAGRARA